WPTTCEGYRGHLLYCPVNLFLELHLVLIPSLRRLSLPQCALKCYRGSLLLPTRTLCQISNNQSTAPHVNIVTNSTDDIRGDPGSSFEALYHLSV
ncbi:hypothetical protein NDU88_002157, partial [Pleurodeles waltl]